MFAMHGGPPGSVDGALGSAVHMIDVWAAAAETAGLDRGVARDDRRRLTSRAHAGAAPVRMRAQQYQLLVWREGRSVTLRGGFALGPYRPSTR